jgi:hypothetical protein
MNKERTTSLFRERLASYDLNGLKLPKIPVEYIITYSGALIGKHFKVLVQVLPFVLYDLVSEDLYKCWKHLGHLAVKIWQTDFLDIEEYAVCLSIAPINHSHL